MMSSNDHAERENQPVNDNPEDTSQKDLQEFLDGLAADLDPNYVREFRVLYDTANEQSMRLVFEGALTMKLGVGSAKLVLNEIGGRDFSVQSLIQIFPLYLMLASAMPMLQEAVPLYKTQLFQAPSQEAVTAVENAYSQYRAKLRDYLFAGTIGVILVGASRTLLDWLIGQTD